MNVLVGLDVVLVVDEVDSVTVTNRVSVISIVLWMVLVVLGVVVGASVLEYVKGKISTPASLSIASI